MSKLISRYLVFIILFFLVFQWMPIRLFIASLGESKTPITIIQDKSISNLIKSKTGENIDKIKISETNHPFAVMIGIPSRPQLVISRGMYETFSDPEIEYVLLHEIGHYQLWHGVIEWFIAALQICFGIFIISKIKTSKDSLLVPILFALILGIISIQVGKISELQADQFALNKISDPKGMIDATRNFQNYHGKKYSQNDNKILQFLFYRANTYDNRIKMAEKELYSRSES